MDSPCPIKQWASVAWLVVCVTCAGCSDAVKLIRSTESGGVVTYSYKEERGHLFSPYREEALRVMQRQCHGSYRIVREGEAKGYSSVSSGIVEGTEGEIRGRRWGIQFECGAGRSDSKS